MPDLPIVENAYRDFLSKEHELHSRFHGSIRHYMDDDSEEPAPATQEVE